jgi:peptidoglycan/LPS O-acetylase OafA/YrhL
MSFEKYNLTNLRTIDLAGFGVTIFFSLSGFLITWLLLREKEKQEIDIKKFYIRRVLRIWPLYYLVLGLSVLTAWCYGLGEYPGSLPYYVFLMANVPFILDTGFPFLGHYWSIGVEEQFYLFWPWIIRIKKHLLKIVFTFTIVFVLAKIICRYIDYTYGYSLPYLIIHVIRFDCMSIGAIGAILVHNNHGRFIKIVKHPAAQILSWLVILLLMVNQFHIASVIDHEIIAVVTVVLIVNLSFNPKTIIKLSHPVFEGIGKISYGIYIVHQLVIFLFAQFLNKFIIPPEFKYPLVYTGVIGLTILTAFLSYTFLEKPILRFKEKFATV